MAKHTRGTRYKKHYDELRRRHFVHEEAAQFAVAQTLRYEEFRKLFRVRRSLWSWFVKHHPELAQGTARFHLAWRAHVKDWYVKRDLDTYNVRMRRVVSPWSWFDRVSYKLPEELRYTKAYRRRTKASAAGEETPSQRAQRIRWIFELKETLKSHPGRAPELVPRILNLGGRVSTQWRRKAGVD